MRILECKAPGRPRDVAKILLDEVAASESMQCVGWLRIGGGDVGQDSTATLEGGSRGRAAAGATVAVGVVVGVTWGSEGEEGEEEEGG